MRNIFIPVGMIVGTAALIWAGNARADPPASMTYLEQTPPLIACDTRKQVDEVLISLKDGTLKEKFAEMQNIKDEHGEAVCVYSVINGAVFGTSEHIGIMNALDQTVDVWVSNVGNHIGVFLIIWGEVVKTSSL